MKFQASAFFQKVNRRHRDVIDDINLHTTISSMTTPEPDRFKTAGSENLTLTPDHRMVYVPRAKDAKSSVGAVPVIVIGAAVVALLILFSANNKSTLPSSASPPPTAPMQVNKASPVSASTVQAFAEPSQEWMTAFAAVMQAATGSDEALLTPSMSMLVKLQPSRTSLTAPQRTSARAHNVQGLAAVKASRFAQAAEQFLAAAQIDPTDPEVAENLGYALYKDAKMAFAISALHQALVNAPQRSTVWGNLGGAYAHAGDQVQAAAAFSLSLRYAKSPGRARSNLVKVYQDDPSEAVRSAAGSALSSHYARLVDPSLRGQLSAFSAFPFSALLPAKIQSTDPAGKTTVVYALNNAEFPLKADAVEYAVWLGSDKDCRVQACIVGLIAGIKSQPQPEGEGDVVELAGGARGVLSKASENKLGLLVTERGGIVYRFAFGNDADLVSMTNSALGLGFIPVTVFTGKDVSRPGQENSAPPEIAQQSSVRPAASSLVGLLNTSPKGSPLSSEQIYKQAANSVVVVTVPDGQGSGVVVAPEIVLTNCHVTKQGPVAVHYRKSKYVAAVLAGDEAMDYCILKVPGLPAAAAPMGPLSDVVPGQRVYSLGSPRGFELTFAEGMVSALRPTAGMPLPIIQTTAPISPGSSGGGLFDEFGRVIGITTFFRVESQNLNFAMPVELFRHLIRAPAPPPATPAVLPAPVNPPTARQTPAPSNQPWSASTCNIDYDIELQTFGEHVSVELRSGAPGASRVVKTQSSQGGRVSFSSLCPASYFVAIGNDDYVSVTPVRQFASDHRYTSQLILQRGASNVAKQSRKTL
ncbi:hypothetical protein [Polaromonas sp. CG9_12]|nr:hypothetical protein [Polaromonas sp. CG9_12]